MPSNAIPKKSINGDSEVWSELVRLGLSMIFAYGGKYSGDTEKCGVEESFMWLVKKIPRNQNLQVYFENSFSTLPLLIRLHKMGILATATFNSNRIRGYPKIWKPMVVAVLISELIWIHHCGWSSGMITKQSFWDPPFQAFSPLQISNVGMPRRRSIVR